MPSGATAMNTASKGRSKTTFRGDIQGLRMVAVVAVVLDHLLGWPSGGFVGVDVFFVISGFLITGLLLREYERSGTISFWGFYKRRIKRIIPVAVLVVALTIVAAWFLFNRTRFWDTFWDGIYATFFSANWRLAAVGTDYFQADSAVSPLQHYWSLSVEEQFYFVWPWLMLAIFYVIARFTRWSQGTARNIAGLVMLAITLISFVWSMYESLTSPTWAYFSTFSRTWELGVGALVAVFASTFQRIPDALRPFLAWAGLAGIGASLFMIDGESTFPAPWAVLPVVATALVIVAGTGGRQKFLAPITNRVSRYVGDISYSMYVWHWPIIIFGFALFGEEPLVVVGLAVAIVLVSVYSYHLFEDPIRRSGWLDSKPRNGRRRRPSASVYTRTHGYLALSMALVVAFGLTAAALQPPNPTSAAPRIELPQPAASETEEPLPPALTSLQASIAESLQATAWPALQPTMDEAISGPQAPPDVQWCGSNPIDVDRCSWGDPASPNVAVTVGSSISMTYVGALRAALPEWRIISLGMFACPIMDPALPPPSSMQQLPTECTERSEEAVETINRLNPEVVFVSGILTPGHGRSELAKITAGSQIVMLPGPPTEINIGECFAPTSSPADCITHMESDWGGTTRGVAADLGATFVDSSVWFCYERLCPSFVGGTPMKRDTVHMTPEYAVMIAPAIRETLDATVLGGTPAG